MPWIRSSVETMRRSFCPSGGDGQCLAGRFKVSMGGPVDYLATYCCLCQVIAPDRIPVALPLYRDQPLSPVSS